MPKCKKIKIDKYNNFNKNGECIFNNLKKKV